MKNNIIKTSDNTYKENSKKGKTVKVVPVFSGKRDVKDVFSEIIINKISNENEFEVEKISNPAYNGIKQ